MAIKLTQAQVEEIFEKEGCKLISEHKGNKVPLEYICSCGKISTIRLDKFKDGQRCKQCASRKIIDKQLYSQQYVEEYFREHGCTLLSEYRRRERKNGLHMFLW